MAALKKLEELIRLTGPIRVFVNRANLCENIVHGGNFNPAWYVVHRGRWYECERWEGSQNLYAKVVSWEKFTGKERIYAPWGQSFEMTVELDGLWQLFNARPLE